MSFFAYRSETLTTTALYIKFNMWPVQGQYPMQIYLHIFQQPVAHVSSQTELQAVQDF